MCNYKKTEMYFTNKQQMASMNLKLLNLTKKDSKFVDMALEAAENSNMLMKHGCVVVENSRVVGTGWNCKRNRFKDNFIGVSCSCHAEMYALRQALKTKTKGKSSPFRKRVGHRLQCEKEA